jgi:hypothetical protein
MNQRRTAMSGTSFLLLKLAPDYFRCTHPTLIDVVFLVILFIYTYCILDCVYMLILLKIVYYYFFRCFFMLLKCLIFVGKNKIEIEMERHCCKAHSTRLNSYVRGPRGKK